MVTPNFSSILDTNLDSVERPLPKPAGSFSGTIKGKPVFDVSSKKKTPFAEVTIANITPLDGEADPDEIAAYEAKHGKLSTKMEKSQFYLTEAALFMLKDFLKACGIETEGRKIRDALDDTPNCEVGFTIVQEPTQDGESMRSRVGRFFALAQD